MSEFNDIRAAIEERLNGISGLPERVSGTPNIAWENWGGFVPDGNDEWIRITLEPASRQPAGSGSLAPILNTGTILFDVYTPKGDGSRDADTLADLIMTNFAAGLILTKNTTTVRIRFAERLGGRNEPPWFRIPVNITWFTYIT